MLFNQAQPTTLIVVYKDEMLVNQLKKLVETNDDTENETVGIIDGSIDIVAWNEKTWTVQKKAGNITSKVLFIGDVKGTEKLTPVIDVKHDKYGIKFGWAGKQAIIYTDDSAVKGHDEYLEFAEELNKLPIPDSFKYIPKNKEEVSEPLEEVATEEIASESIEQPDQQEKEHKFKGLFKAKNAIQQTIDQAENVAKKIGNDAAQFTHNIKDKKTIKTQQMLYGVIKFYFEGLDKFINS